MPYNIDENHHQVIAWFEECYWSVFDAAAVGHGFTDLVVGGYHQQKLENITTLVEVKTAAGQLRPSQKDFFETWRGSVHIARTRADVWHICGLEGPPAADPGRGGQVSKAESDYLLFLIAHDLAWRDRIKEVLGIDENEFYRIRQNCRARFTK